jgi:CheY-like chemotaxis protein
VLIVDDDPVARAGLCELLTAQGYLAEEAEDGQHAIEQLEAGMRPGVVLIDLTLPRVSGAEVIAFMHTHPALRHVPTIVMTATPRDQVNLLTDVVFEKPLDLEKLLRTLSALADFTPSS